MTRRRRSLRTALAVAFLLAAAGCDATTGSFDNAKVRDAIEGAGIDPSSELRYEHFLYFAEETGARAAAAELALDFEVDVQPPGDGFDDWALLATQTASLDDDELDALTESLVQLADRLGGEYDGWGTALR